MCHYGIVVLRARIKVYVLLQLMGWDMNMLACLAKRRCDRKQPFHILGC